MRQPVHADQQSTEEMPPLVGKLLLLSAIGSIGLAALAIFYVRPGFEELLGLKKDPWGELDRGVALVAGLPAALAGLFAAWQGWAGRPKTPSRIAAIIGVILNLAVLLGVGVPFLLAYLKTV
jgi:hypothetical protein